MERPGIASMERMRPQKTNRRKTDGFVLLELITVIILIGLVAVVVSARGLGDNALLMRESEIIKAHLRHVRSLALSNDLYRWKLTFSLASSPHSYSLWKVNQDDSSDTKAIPLPHDNLPTHALPSGLRMSVRDADDTAASAIRFDQWGGPVGGSYAIRVYDKLGNEKNITITKNTGFVQ